MTSIATAPVNVDVRPDVITGGVDTHRDVHVAAALDGRGAELDTRGFPTTPAGYRSLIEWLRSFGTAGRPGEKPHLWTNRGLVSTAPVTAADGASSGMATDGVDLLRRPDWEPIADALGEVPHTGPRRTVEGGDWLCRS